MLNCKIAKGIAAECETTIGGILRLAFANYDDSYATAWTASVGCEVDSLKLVNDEHAYEVNFLDGSGLAEVELNVGDSTDQKNFTHRITMNLAKLDCNLLDQYKNWSLAHVIAFVQQKDGSVYAYGVNNGLAATTFNYSSGSATSDAVGVNAVFEGVQLDAPLKIKDWATVKALFQTEG